MGIDFIGQICVMIHSGSRGFGHQVATDALLAMEKAMKRDNIEGKQLFLMMFNIFALFF